MLEPPQKTPAEQSTSKRKATISALPHRVLGKAMGHGGSMPSGPLVIYISWSDCGWFTYRNQVILVVFHTYLRLPNVCIYANVCMYICMIYIYIIEYDFMYMAKKKTSYGDIIVGISLYNYCEIL